MRPGEMLGLRWVDIDLEDGVVRVQRALAWSGGDWELQEPKTMQSRRTIPLPRGAVSALRTHRAEQLETRLVAGTRWQVHDLVFCTDTGLPLNPHNIVNRYFKPTLLAAGLPKSVRLYDLRHTCATLLLAAGENPKVVAERLGTPVFA